MSSPHDPRCRKCARPLAAADAVRLWDGRNYCRECVEGEMPGLAEYAAGHPRLEETAPLDGILQLKHLLSFHGGVLAIVAALITLLVSTTTGDVTNALLLTLVLMLPVGLICLLGIAMAYWDFRRSIPTVIAANGAVQCWRTGEARRSFRLELPRHLRGCRLDRETPIDRLRWRMGRPNQDQRLGDLPSRIAKLDVVLLEFPYESKLGELFARYSLARRFAACGWTDVSRMRWLTFLRLAGVPCLKPTFDNEN